MNSLTLKTLALSGLVASAAAEDYQYWTGNGCAGSFVSSGTFACYVNPMPSSPLIHGINLLFANGLRAEFYDSKDCTGSPWFTDDGTGGCVTDAAARTNCIYIPC